MNPSINGKHVSPWQLQRQQQWLQPSAAVLPPSSCRPPHCCPCWRYPQPQCHRQHCCGIIVVAGGIEPPFRSLVCASWLLCVASVALLSCATLFLLLRQLVVACRMLLLPSLVGLHCPLVLLFCRLVCACPVTSVAYCIVPPSYPLVAHIASAAL
jgi:hypothetical protein